LIASKQIVLILEMLIFIKKSSKKIVKENEKSFWNIGIFYFSNLNLQN